MLHELHVSQAGRNGNRLTRVSARLRLRSQHLPGAVHYLSEARRRAIFAAVAVARTEGLSVPASQAIVSVRFHISLEAVAQVEREGLTGGWSVEGIPTHPAAAA
jgi:hypothetical protein